MSNYCKNCYELTEELENHKRWIKDYKQKLKDAEEFANAKIKQCENLIKQLNETHEQLDQLKAENEELKNFHINLVGVKECEIRELVKLKAENDLLRKTHKTEQDRRRAYEQALTEIKEIINICEVNNCNSECELFKMDDCQDERLYRIRQILQKISEVLDDI